MIPASRYTFRSFNNTKKAPTNSSSSYHSGIWTIRKKNHQKLLKFSPRTFLLGLGTFSPFPGPVKGPV